MAPKLLADGLIEADLFEVGSPSRRRAREVA
jgi:hypothetical protein